MKSIDDSLRICMLPRLMDRHWTARSQPEAFHRTFNIQPSMMDPSLHSWLWNRFAEHYQPRHHDFERDKSHPLQPNSDFGSRTCIIYISNPTAFKHNRGLGRIDPPNAYLAELLFRRFRERKHNITFRVNIN